MSDIDTIDAFYNAEEVSYNMDIGRGILSIKELEEAIDYLQEHGERHGIDHDLQANIIEILSDEVKGILNDVLYTYHLAKTGGQEDQGAE